MPEAAVIPLQDDEPDLQYYAIEATPSASKGKRSTPVLVAVVADMSRELALQVVGGRYGYLFPNHTLTARVVGCPGIPEPLPIEGWLVFQAPDKARCPSCRRAFIEILPGYEWRVRLIPGTEGKRIGGALPPLPRTGSGQGRHVCTRSACKAVLEVIVTRRVK